MSSPASTAIDARPHHSAPANPSIPRAGRATGARHRPLRPLVLAVLLAGGGVSGAEITPAAAQPSEDRVVAIGDIHGADGALLEILEAAGLTDADGRWTGGRATLVQTGDFTDRGPGVRVVMDHLRRLQREADDAGGQAHVLLGNHETMNLTANVRDATPEIFASFAEADASRRRERALADYRAHAERRREALGRPLPGRLRDRAWLEAHPPGMLEYLDAFGPDGEYGRWLRELPVVHAIDGTLFVHGGLAPQLQPSDVEAINDAVRDELERFDHIRRHLVARDVILPFSTFAEMIPAVDAELAAWIVRLFPGPPEPGAPPPAVSAEDRTHIDLLLEFERLGGWLIIDGNGPLWFRGFARWTEEEGDAAIGGVLTRYGADRVVAGHNVTRTRQIGSRFGGRVWLVDTGMLASAYGGQPSALELAGEAVTAIYRNGRRPLVPVTASAR